MIIKKTVLFLAACGLSFAPAIAQADPVDHRAEWVNSYFTTTFVKNVPGYANSPALQNYAVELVRQQLTGVDQVKCADDVSSCFANMPERMVPAMQQKAAELQAQGPQTAIPQFAAQPQAAGHPLLTYFASGLGRAFLWMGQQYVEYNTNSALLQQQQRGDLLTQTAQRQQHYCNTIYRLNGAPYYDCR